ncbi:MAG: hypothetical protein S0880_34210 [Actinomycetota bacterium]|nr:hypothetical protein [Actinomycetota bacterium]
MWSAFRTSERSALLEDCDALLDGRLAERLLTTERPVPSWAWVDLLAHGSERALRRPPMVAATIEDRRWCRARSYLAGEVMMVVDTGEATLAELQRDVLVPLELELLDLAADREVTTRETPVTLSLRVMARIDANRRARRRARRASR